MASGETGNADNSYKTPDRSNTMFTPAHARATTAYKRVSAETSVQNADPHRLVHLLFEELLKSLANARGAMARKAIAEKGAAISHCVRIIEEGLKAGLNEREGGELAQNLSRLYDYCVVQLTKANARNDESLIQEVRSLIEPVAQAWQEINPRSDVQSNIVGA
jgi:flagellar protein FliS